MVRAFAEALEIIPYTLAENAGLNPIQVVTELRNKHAHGIKDAGVSMRKTGISEDMMKDNVLQPALVTQSALTLATECVRMILKIDDLVIFNKNKKYTISFKLSIGVFSTIRRPLGI